MKYVPHPRFGDEPLLTGLNPCATDAGVHLHWHNEIACEYSWSRPSRAIPGTAVLANTEAQFEALFPVTHYFDLERVCLDCQKPFLFFAEEQQHWYEQLHFPLEADCVRCAPCRKSMRDLQQLRYRYEDLEKLEVRSDLLEHELAETRLSLIEERVFSSKQGDAVRAFCNRFPDHPQTASMRRRLEDIVGEAGHGGRFVKGARRGV